VGIPGTGLSYSRLEKPHDAPVIAPGITQRRRHFPLLGLLGLLAFLAFLTLLIAHVRG
jgi:hypothetical protein